MNYSSLLRPYSARCARFRLGAARRGAPLALAALIAWLPVGCFRASGIQRTDVVAEAVPEFQGDRVTGTKAVSGPGDYYMGNDFLQVAVDGNRYGDTINKPLAGAVSGGSIVDASYIALDTSYQRVNISGDLLERLTPVVNQDPSMQIVIDSYLPQSTSMPASLTMTGGILDPGHRIPGASWDGNNRLQGVSVVHTLSLDKLNRYLVLSTTIHNDSGAILGIRNIGDCLVQTSPGFLFAVPAGLDVNGNPLATNWGVQIPGSDWGSPLATSVQAPFVAFMATEPGDPSMDAHASLGIMNADSPYSIVASDPQDALGLDRPSFASRCVVGSLPISQPGLAAGGSLTYNRWFFVAGGASSDPLTPNQATGLFNQMILAKFNNASGMPDQINGIWPLDYGTLSFSLMGTAAKQGPLPTEVRIERQAAVSNSAPVWVPERVEWLEPGENVTSQTAFASSTVTELLPVGTYRLVITNKAGTLVQTTAVNAFSGLGPLIERPIAIYPLQLFSVGSTDYLCPEASQIVSGTKAVVRNLYSPHFFVSRPSGAPTSSLQPLRITLKGTNGVPDPWTRRARTLGSYFNPIEHQVWIAMGNAPGQDQYRAGNQMFGTAFCNYLQNEYFWLPNGTATGQVNASGTPVVNGGTYRAYGTLGPLHSLQWYDIVAYDGQSDNATTFIVPPEPLPAGWTTFDLPGPSIGTGGRILTGEKLASAMAEGVHVVGNTEVDVATNAFNLYNNFTWEFNAAGFLQTHLAAIGNDPFILNARTSNLPNYGSVTSLFTPDATLYRFGGALQPDNWTLADFITQAQGAFTVIHQPRGAAGLFTEQGFDPAAAPGQGANAWMSAGGAYAVGVTNGSFDAIELLRGEGFDPSNPDPWFQQFLQVRSDWFGLLNHQGPASFTKALGLSGTTSSLDWPVGLARTYLKASPALTFLPQPTIAPDLINAPLVQDLSTVKAALKAGAAVASTGPFLDVNVGGTGPGGLVAGPMPTANLNINLYRTDWMPLDEVRIVVNGAVVATLDPAALTPSATDARLSSGSFPVAMPTTGTGAWIVVEAGVRLTQTGPLAPGTPWAWIQRGIYPIAVTNPIFVDVTGNGYTHP